MMKNLIYKELMLVIPKGVFLFALLSAVLLIPSYPYVVGVIYFVFSIQILTELAFTNKDLEFTALLPIPRRHIVIARSISVGIVQISQLICAIPFALISSFVLWKGGNPIGMDANFAFFGLALIYFSAFNLVFLPKFFRTCTKLAVPLISAIVVFALFAIIGEFLIALIPTLNGLFDGLTASGRLFRVGVLIVGIAVYILTMLASVRIAVKRFEKVSL